MHRLFVIFILFTLTCCQTEIENKQQKIDWLKSNAQPIHSINPDSSDFFDFNFLKSELDSVTIIGLGEQTHGDGSSFLAKTKLIKYLHQHQGFSVLVFESSLYECNLAWKMLLNKESADSAFRKGWFKVWAQSEHTIPLRNYIQEKSQQPDSLRLIGFDLQSSGTLKPTARIEYYQKFLNKHNIDTSAYTALWKILKYKSPKDYYYFKRDTILINNLYKQTSSLKETTEKIICTTIDDLITQRTISQLNAYFRFILNMSQSDPPASIINIRDSVMAANVIWLKEKIFPDQKLLLWAANSHLNYNRELLQYPDKKFVSMGHHLKKHFKNQYYTVSFTSYDGKANSLVNGTKPTPQASNKTLEYLLTEANFQHAFISSQQLNVSPLGKGFQARPYGYTNYSGRWPEMTDAFFFIKTMEPSVVKTEK